MKKIILTGGGTAGHVTPNLALAPELSKRGFKIRYIGSYSGIEKNLAIHAGIPYDGISTGKLRRYFNLKNFSDPFRIIKGYFEAKKLLKKYKPDIIFSKGGFVTVPVVLAASKYKIPIVMHESDMTPGLANKICLPFSSKICCNFPETIDCLPSKKAKLTGTPIRSIILNGSREKGLKFTGFNGEKPVLMIIGGSLGSVIINNMVRSILDILCNKFHVLHLCGKGNIDEKLNNNKDYLQYEYINEELGDLFALTDIVISRAGANAICELLALRKPNILIPLSAKASRGDQLLNAISFEKQGFSNIILEENLTMETLFQVIQDTFNDKDKFISNMKNSKASDSVNIIADLLESIL